MESILPMGSEQDRIHAQAEQIRASGVLGRSRFYTALFDYLLDCSGRGHVPKEVEIAADVFDRGDGFDPSQDSMVRVYAHNLRQKLQQFYAGAGSDESEQLTLPKGEYRIALVARPVDAVPAADPVAAPAARSGIVAVAAIVLAVIAGGLLGRLTVSEPGSVAVWRELAASPLWAEVSDDELPVTIVVGDYYIFGERDQYGNVARMVREFDVNSSDELADRLMFEPDDADRYVDLALTYLPTSIASALGDVMVVLAAAGKDVSVVATSNLDTALIRESHIVYLGYLSGLGMLSDFAFADSELAIGRTFDEVVNTRSGDAFVSEAGLPTARGSYRDYGLFATLPGPGGNRLIIIAGMRDEGLMQAATAASDPDLVAASVEAVAAGNGGPPDAFEVLYEVAGMDRTNLAATIVHAAARDSADRGGALP